MRNVLEQVLKGNEVTQSTLGVLVLGDGYVTYLLLGEHELKIVVHHDVLTSEAAEVFGHDAVDFPGLHIIHHPLKAGTLEVRSTPSVIDIFAIHRKAMFLCVLLQNGALGLDTHAVAIVFVVTAETHIECCVINFRLFQINLLCAKQPALMGTLYRERGLLAMVYCVA